MALPRELRERLTLPAFAAPMFLCSGVDLAIECCKAGIVGSLTRNHCRDLAELEQQLHRVTDALVRCTEASPGRKIGPLAVNLATTFGHAEMKAHLDACRRYGVQIIVTAAGDPTPVAPLIHAEGMLHFHDATTLRFAEKAIAAGVDGIIAIGAGGGGHAGTISHLVFVPQIRAIFDGVIVMAGAIAHGVAIRAAEVLGADLAYLGTRLIASPEAMASDAYKTMLVQCDAQDLIYTRGVNGLAASWLKPSLRDAGLDPDNLGIPAGHRTDHLPAGKMPWRDIWSAGQGVGLIHDVPPTAEIIGRLRQQYLAACATPAFGTVASPPLPH